MLRLERGGDRVTREAGVEDAVDRQALLLQPQRAELVRGARRFSDRTCVGRGDEHHGGQRGLGQRRERARETIVLHRQPGVQPQTRRASIVPVQKARPRAGQAQQPQRVPRGRGVEDEVIEPRGRVGEQRREFIERGDLRRARA
jgi:hypothetical protein